MRRLTPFLLACLILVLVPVAADAAGGTALGWGYNEHGEVGNGTTGGSCNCVETPSPVTGLAEATELSGGYYHSLALKANGTVMAWGYNAEGQLGDGTTNESSTPVSVSGLSNVVSVSAGAEHSLALLSNGTVMAWGDNTYGELGFSAASGPETCGSSACSRLPVAVPGITNAVAISAGYYDNTVLLADGTVLVWGYDYYGELGNGTAIETGCECIPSPTLLAGVTRAVAISNGWYHGGALLSDGTLQAWGYDYEGQLGNGTPVREGCRCLGPVQVAGVSGARSVEMGGYHGATLLPDGSTRIWGENYYGQLGIGSNTRTGCDCFATPLGGPASGLLAIDTAGYHTLALKADGTLLAWGEDSDGQLGDGTTTEERASPVAVKGASGASAVAGKNYTSFALVGPSQQLQVAFAGAGSGKVGGAASSDSSQAIICPGACSGHYPQGQVEILRAEPDAGTGFAGFSGPCTGTGPCQVTMNGDQTVTATFGPAKGTAITKARINHKKHTATFSFSTPGAITGYECKLVRPARKRHHRAKASAKSAKAKFSRCSSPKTYHHLNPVGSYRFAVRGVDSLGPDAVPAKHTFKMKAKRKRHHHKHGAR
jgi:alpha-tubulin suppressor-like RCC1 family protein